MLWATQTHLVLYYEPLQHIWFCAMGHCSTSGSVLWATVAHLVLCYWPLWGIWFCAMGHCRASGSVLWATVPNCIHCSGQCAEWDLKNLQNVCHRPIRQIWLCTTDHCQIFLGDMVHCREFSSSLLHRYYLGKCSVCTLLVGDWGYYIYHKWTEA
jgi:hypothetical protein